jgi:hypothetical protein
LAHRLERSVREFRWCPLPLYKPGTTLPKERDELDELDEQKPQFSEIELMADKPSTWTAERRAWQAMLIHTWQPWKKSTGPRDTRGEVQVLA